MLTDDKKITTPDYWNRIYTGNNDNAKVDASNTKRPANAFDRFSWVADCADGFRVLGVASGHAHVEKRIKAAHPNWTVIASDQAQEAMIAAKYMPYLILDAYILPFKKRHFDTIICTQALEYMEDQGAFLKMANYVARCLLLTVPIGEMEKWSQLRIYTEQNVKSLLEPYGRIVVFDRQGDLLLVKLVFHD